MSTPIAAYLPKKSEEPKEKAKRPDCLLIHHAMDFCKRDIGRLTMVVNGIDKNSNQPNPPHIIEYSLNLECMPTIELFKNGIIKMQNYLCKTKSEIDKQSGRRHIVTDCSANEYPNCFGGMTMKFVFELQPLLENI